MKILGLITEYNPFHNGHIHHIQSAKNLIKPDLTIVIMSGNFVQRGEPAIIDKWQRTKIALQHEVDLVIELPFVYALQGADYFALGAVKLLEKIGVTDICFGSESGDVTKLYQIAQTIKDNPLKYDEFVKNAMSLGLSYPDACNQALSTLLHKPITTPNDILGLCYVKAVVNHDFDIQMHCIPRTNDFHSVEIKKISSATAIRLALKENQEVMDTLPLHHLYDQNLHFLEDYFPYLKYYLSTVSPNQLKQIFMVDEGIENNLIKNITNTNSMNEFIQKVQSKRYTRVRIQRMIIHILMQNTRKEILEALDIDYIRVLGMNQLGQQYLNQIKKDCQFKIVTTFSKHQHPALLIEQTAAKLYQITDSNCKIEHFEYAHPPIIVK